jgi:Uma2 family endonuclease
VKTQSKLGPSSAGLLMTPEEFDAVTDYDDRYRYELIHGIFVVTPIPSEAEGDANEELGYWLRSYRDHHLQGYALDLTLAERYVRLPGSRRRADRVIWARLGRQPDPKADHLAIVVEFVSRRRRDRTRDYDEKRREYLALGIVEYWIIDRFHRTMTVSRNQPGAMAEQVIAEDETYRTDLLPGFDLPLARLLAVSDKWQK